MFLLSISPSGHKETQCYEKKFVEIGLNKEMSYVEENMLFSNVKRAILDFGEFDTFNIFDKSLPNLEVSLYNIPDDVYKNIDLSSITCHDREVEGKHYFCAETCRDICIEEYIENVEHFMGYTFSFGGEIEDKSYREGSTILRMKSHGNKNAIALFNCGNLIYGESFIVEEEVSRYLNYKIENLLKKILSE